MLLVFLFACSSTNTADTTSPICNRVHIQDAGTGAEHVVICSETGQPAYDCDGGGGSCWLDAGGDAVFDYNCNRPADKDDAAQELSDYCGGFTEVQ